MLATFDTYSYIKGDVSLTFGIEKNLHSLQNKKDFLDLLLTAARDIKMEIELYNNNNNNDNSNTGQNRSGDVPSQNT